MALDFLKLHDPKLVEAYNAKPAKDVLPSLRKKVMDGIKKAMESLAASDHNPRHKWYGVRDGNSVAQIRLGRTPLALKGTTDFGVPREQLVNFYTQAGRACEAGELDEAIQEAHESSNKQGAGTTRRASSGGGREIEPWKVYRRNISRYGQKRADELLDTKMGADAAKVRADFKANS